MLLHFIPIWSALRPFGICNLWPLDIVCGHLLYFWYVCTKKNLATLIWMGVKQEQHFSA
jgi:hypothetical protein